MSSATYFYKKYSIVDVCINSAGLAKITMYGVKNPGYFPQGKLLLYSNILVHDIKTLSHSLHSITVALRDTKQVREHRSACCTD